MKKLLINALDWCVGFFFFGILSWFLRLIDPKATRMIKRLRKQQERERMAPKLTHEQLARLRAKVLQEFKPSVPCEHNAMVLIDEEKPLGRFVWRCPDCGYRWRRETIIKEDKIA